MRAVSGHRLVLVGTRLDHNDDLFAQHDLVYDASLIVDRRAAGSPAPRSSSEPFTLAVPGSRKLDQGT
jgi:hypothetical protein